MDMRRKKIENQSEKQLNISEDFLKKIIINPPVKSELSPLINNKIWERDWYSIDLLLGKLSIDELNGLIKKFNESKNRNGKSYWSKSLKIHIYSLFEKYAIPISCTLTESSLNFEALKFLFSDVLEKKRTESSSHQNVFPYKFAME